MNATAACEKLNEEARSHWGNAYEEFGLDPEDFDDDEELEMFNMEDRLRVQRGILGPDPTDDREGIFGSAAGVPFYEIIEVELEGVP